MEISTTRFGTISVDETDMLFFPAGLIGFESCRRWALLSDPNNDAVAWLQSLERPETALAVVSPRRFAPQRRLRVARQELSGLGLDDLRQAEVLAVVSKGPTGLAMNLKAPIVVNVACRTGCQAIVNGDEPLAALIEPAPAPLRRSA